MSAAVARHGIANTLGRYAATFSAGDVEQTVLCFTKDAEVEFPACVALGRAEIARELTRLREIFRAAGETPWILISNTVIEAAGSGVSAISAYVSFTKQDDASVSPRSGGYYIDTFVECDAEWLIDSRRVVI